jgi:hypothetical protein
VVLGFILSFTCTIFTVGGLFNQASFGSILGLLFVFCLSAVPFAFFLTSFFDTPQTAGQATLAILVGKQSHQSTLCLALSNTFPGLIDNGLAYSVLFCLLRCAYVGFYVVFVAVFSVDNLTIPYHTAQYACCLFPPLALQMGTVSFLKSYDGIPLSSICGMMVRSSSTSAYAMFC